MYQSWGQFMDIGLVIFPPPTCVTIRDLLQTQTYVLFRVKVLLNLEGHRLSWRSVTLRFHGDSFKCIFSFFFFFYSVSDFLFFFFIFSFFLFVLCSYLYCNIVHGKNVMGIFF